VSLLGINACSPLATNALRDNIWDNFSSESYKQLPAVGAITIRNPLNGEEMQYDLPGGGRGYTRPASLVSLWSTAPFLQNNTVGPFGDDPSVAARMDRFDKSIRQMLWPDTRDKDPILFADKKGPDIGLIDRLTTDSYLDVAAAYIPAPLRPLINVSRHAFPFLGGSGGSISIGPFPKGFPVGLITNVDVTGGEMPEPQRKEHVKKLVRLFTSLTRELKGNPDFATVIKNHGDDLLDVSKCKDLVVNKGHYFGTDYFTEEPGLSDSDKEALISFLKTF
jgi:hypothetical protein